MRKVSRSIAKCGYIRLINRLISGYMAICIYMIITRAYVSASSISCLRTTFPLDASSFMCLASEVTFGGLLVAILAEDNLFRI